LAPNSLLAMYAMGQVAIVNKISPSASAYIGENRPCSSAIAFTKIVAGPVSMNMPARMPAVPTIIVIFQANQAPGLRSMPIGLVWIVDRPTLARTMPICRPSARSTAASLRPSTGHALPGACGDHCWMGSPNTASSAVALTARPSQASSCGGFASPIRLRSSTGSRPKRRSSTRTRAFASPRSSPMMIPRSSPLAPRGELLRRLGKHLQPRSHLGELRPEAHVGQNDADLSPERAEHGRVAGALDWACTLRCVR
jgi:hypothetical protein